MTEQKPRSKMAEICKPLTRRAETGMRDRDTGVSQGEEGGAERKDLQENL